MSPWKFKWVKLKKQKQNGFPSAVLSSGSGPRLVAGRPQRLVSAVGLGDEAWSAEAPPHVNVDS